MNVKNIKAIEYFFIFFIFFFIVQPSLYAQPAPRFENLTIVVSSCDRYSSLWKGFFEQFFKHFNSLHTLNKDIPILLITNKKTFNHPKVTVIQFLNDPSWSDNMLLALQHVKTDYILYLQEDYFFIYLDEQRLAKIYNYMQARPNVAYIQVAFPSEFFKGSPITDFKGIYYKDHDMLYRTALQASFWKKEIFQHLLKSGENAWDFELQGSVRSQNLNNTFLLVKENIPMDYLNVVYGGYVYDKTLELAQQYGIALEHDFPLARDHRLYLWYHRTFLPFLYWKMYKPVKELIKSFL